MNDLDLVKYYFELSNKADLKNIKMILSKDIVYNSDNVGTHFGRDNVMDMKSTFFGKFKHINWNVEKIVEIKKNIFNIDFNFSAILLDHTEINKNGKETLIVKDGKIYFIQVKNT